MLYLQAAWHFPACPDFIKRNDLENKHINGKTAAHWNNMFVFIIAKHSWNRKFLLLFNQFIFVFYRLMHIHYKAILSFVYLYPSEFGNKGNQVSAYETEKKILLQEA